MAWLLVVVAGLFETGFALALKASDAFTRLLPSVLFLVCAALGAYGFVAEVACRRGRPTAGDAPARGQNRAGWAIQDLNL